MNIFILTEGKETGPFSEEATQTLIEQGTVAATDLAWVSGMTDWAPLSEILPASSGAQKPAAEPAEPVEGIESDSMPVEMAPSDPATAKQRVFLLYLGISFPADLSKEQASTRLNEAMETPALAQRISSWSTDRLRLHPDLFAAEIHARKEDRANHFFDVCQTEGAQYFTRITKAHCQVLVTFLDAKFPTWDSRMRDAATNYFFPAIAEKFPQLIERQWKNHFHYAEEPGSESLRKPPTARIKRRPVSPLEAVLRGFALGVVILCALYFGQKMLPSWEGSGSAEKEQAKSGSAASSPTRSVASGGSPKTAPPSSADASAPKTKKDNLAGKKTPPEEIVGTAPTPASEDDSKIPASNFTTSPSNAAPGNSSQETPPAAANPLSTTPSASKPSTETKPDLVLIKPVER